MSYRIVTRCRAPLEWQPEARRDGVYVRDLKDSRWHVAKVNGQTLGFGATAHPWPDHTRLYSLWVRPQWRGHGIGADLVRHRIAETDTSTYTLYTSLPEFFRQFGFTVDKEYEDSVRMRRAQTE